MQCRLMFYCHYLRVVVVVVVALSSIFTRISLLIFESFES
jgi:hypothetical protein